MIAYHGTYRKYKESIDQNGFIQDADLECKRYLGAGVYFYDSKNNAIDWIIKKASENNVQIKSLKDFNDNGLIYQAELELNDNNVLDLDDREQLDRFFVFCQYVKTKMLEDERYKKIYEAASCREYISIFLNFSREYGALDGIQVITRTITETINGKYNELGISHLPRKVICVKDNKVIKSYTDMNNIEQNEYNISKALNLNIVS